MKHLPILLLIFLFIGCSHTMTVSSNYSNSNAAMSDGIPKEKKNICLVLSNSFRTYKFEKKAYNWAGGSLFPDTLTFELGQSLSEDLLSLARAHYTTSMETPDLASALSSKIQKAEFILVAEVERVALELPTLRFGDIESEVDLRYSLYDGEGKFINSSSVRGQGKKAVVFTKENYVIALQEAIKDLLAKTGQYLKSNT